MGLTREEIEEFKRQHLQTLEMEEARRIEERQQREERPNGRHHAHAPESAPIDRETELRKIKEQIEEQFYKKRGYKRYVDHKGRVLWLTPEEYAFRVARRKRNEANVGGNLVLKKRLHTIGLYLVVALIAMAAGMFLTR